MIAVTSGVFFLRIGCARLGNRADACAVLRHRPLLLGADRPVDAEQSERRHGQTNFHAIRASRVGSQGFG